MQTMMSPEKVLDKIRELSSEYMVARMPVRIEVLEQSLGLAHEQLMTHLQELNLSGLVFFNDNYVLLSYKGFGVTP